MSAFVAIYRDLTQDEWREICTNPKAVAFSPSNQAITDSHRELLRAARKAVLALAHVTQRNQLDEAAYGADYRALSAALETASQHDR